MNHVALIDLMHNVGAGFHPCPNREEEINMLIKNPKFEISAVSPKQYPKNHLSEIVLAGKSNVGKSSFINTLINRKNLARTSSQPGKTRQINFYNMDELFYFVDLPGYGYSKMSKEEQLKVGQFIEKYLSIRENIQLIVLILDIRHKPTEDDKLMYNYIRSTNIPFIIIANKADKIAVTKVNESIDEIKKELNIIAGTVVVPFSSERRIYTEETWNEISKLIIR